jgi:2-haloacid dehalogenase
MIAFGDVDVLSFDCYGTLIDWETGLVQALRPILHAHGVQQDDEEATQKER